MVRPKRNVLAVGEESITPPDELASNQYLARMVRAEGSNLYSCELPSRGKGRETVLVELAQRFRKTIWIKRGGYVLVEIEPVETRKSGSKVDGEIINVVGDEKLWRKQKYWPAEFAKTSHGYDDEDEEESNQGKLPPSDSDMSEDSNNAQ